MSDVRFYKVLVFVNSVVPLALLSLDAFRGNLGTNPIEFFLRTTGVLTLVFAMLTISVTPLRKFLELNQLVKVRRMLGLFVFFYATIHLVTYSIFDKGLVVYDIIADVGNRPFIAIGMAAFLMLVPLAATSTNGWVKRLGGKRWALLHKLAYAVPMLGVIHYWMIQKSDYFWPAIFGIVYVVLMGARRVDGRPQEVDGRR